MAVVAVAVEESHDLDVAVDDHEEVVLVDLTDLPLLAHEFDVEVGKEGLVFFGEVVEQVLVAKHELLALGHFLLALLALRFLF